MSEPKKNENRRETTISYEETSGSQTIARIAADLAPVPHKYTTRGRDYEYKRLGTVSLMDGIDLYDCHVHALVSDRHRSREFSEFWQEMDHYYLSDWKIQAGNGQPLSACLQGEPQMVESSTGSFRICIRSQTPFVAQHG